MLDTNSTEIHEALKELGKGPYTTEMIEDMILKQRAEKAKPKKKRKKK